MGTFGSRGGLILHAPLKRPSCASHEEEAQEKTERTGPGIEAPAAEKAPVSQAVGSVIQGMREKSGSK